ncbi:hypothetical protein phiAS5_ORF0285 [Aeromonas phage phiAS5]|uniref:Uncharacterized protein n=1 Tax=Aeromonas phage phiAS5 TaxID=879630 RepID=E1A239_9CAUD|nr:hypothetical protein phiAS5_ORF0285 [Aeromonas phage phiAS5]ADM80128.1 hypothetical protein phiAS5_ORF0285 [Aeromonas phage phiAS5]
MCEAASMLLHHWQDKHPTETFAGYELWTDLEQGDYRFEIISDAFTMKAAFSITIGADVLKEPEDLYRVVVGEMDKIV